MPGSTVIIEALPGTREIRASLWQNLLLPAAPPLLPRLPHRVIGRVPRCSRGESVRAIDGAGLASVADIWYACRSLGLRSGSSGMRHQVVAMASDHAGFELKELLKKDLEALSYSVVDLGCRDAAPVDYPDMGYALAQALRAGEADRGVLICGSGIGISIAANRFPEIRAALIHDALGARLARQHNDANVICFGGRLIGADVARDCLRIFLATEFEGGRHAPRVDKLSRPN